MSAVARPPAELDSLDTPVSDKKEPFTEEEREKIEMVKAALCDEDRNAKVVDDFFILRFLIARDMNVKKATQMLANHLKWRRQNDTDTWLERSPPPKYELLAATECIHKIDKEGNPVAYWNNGYFYSHMSQWFTVNEYAKIALYDAEKNMQTLQKLSREQNRLVRFTFVGDLAGLNSNASKAQKLGKKVSMTLADNYPEVLNVGVGMHVPWLATVVWNAFKRFVDPNVVAKTQLYADFNFDALSKLVDPENIPKKYGGLCECEGGCVPDIPESELNGDEIKGSGVPEDLEEVQIGAKKQLERVIECPEGGEFVWYFVSQHDLNFSVTFHKSTPSNTPKSDDSLGTPSPKSETGEPASANTEKEEVHELEKVPKNFPMSGAYSAPEAGHCRFFWSNESRFRSKTVKLFIKCANAGVAGAGE